MASLVSLIFALEVDGAPVLTFEAGSAREARELCKEEWLRADLRLQTSNRNRLCRPDSKLSIRRATADEAEIFNQSINQSAQPAEFTDDLLLAYLVELDDLG